MSVEPRETNDSIASLVLIAATIVALICANTALAEYYSALLNLKMEFRFGTLGISKPLLLWINDGLMAVFFFLVGLEIKYEMREGSLSTPAKATLPVVAAVGGMAVPAAIYIFIAWDDSAALRGWAIPAATDIAFAVGVLGLLGRRVPPTLKAFVLALAVIDDLGAIVIIALFYAHDLSLISLALAGFFVVALGVMNWLGVMRASAYVLVGIALWICVLESGVHATLAGVIAALFVPIRGAAGQEGPLHAFEADLKVPVYFGIMPIFAFANAGVPLTGLSAEAYTAAVTTGVALGLLLGKPIGVVGATAVYAALAKGSLPAGATWLHMLGAGCLAGIGFTMSLFIGTLAFEEPELLNEVRLGVLVGSFLSAVAGSLILIAAARRQLT
jgi:NhaA family Na+:H+ antiporter